MLNCGISRLIKDPTENIIKTKQLSNVKIDQLKSCEFFPVADNICLVKIDVNCKLYIRGAVDVSSINCLLNINGKSVKTGESVKIFSVLGCSAFYIETLNRTEHYCSINSDFNNIINKYKDNYCLFLLKSIINNQKHIYEELKLNGIAYFPDLIKAKGLSLFPQAEKHLKCLFDQRLGDRIDRKLVIDENWKETLINENHDESLPERIMICGGKGFGKSTLLRYLMNKAQELEDSPVLVDFDPGQPEMFLPGTISYNIVSDPLIGPSYTHLRTPRWSCYVGEVDVDKNVNGYLEAVLRLSEMLDRDEGLKSKRFYLINTMGYSRGIGVLFQCAIVRAIKPTKLIILDSNLDKYKTSNFSEPLINNPVATELLDSMNFPNYEFNCDVLRIKAPIDYVFKSIVYPENRLTASDVRRAIQVCYFANATSKAFIIHVSATDKLSPYQAGDIVVFAHKTASLHTIEFGEVLCWNCDNNELKIRTPGYLEEIFQQENVVIVDVIRTRNIHTQWRSLEPQFNSSHQANQIYSTVC
ncbi:hypothetical protein O3M35_004537 [Rhynocoris fuscipes]|uniref:Clp1 P-loop domain-containing protein n=1 Tax=Rhynocoris fuscipes TaxID=488301 RepID=A0AAW1CLQ5_9HEMI